MASMRPNVVRGTRFIKDLTAVLVAGLITLYSIIGLLSADLNRDNTSSVSADKQEAISDLRLRFKR